MQNKQPFQKRIEPQQKKTFLQMINSFATTAMNTISSSIIPHYTYEGNPYIYNAVCDCLNTLNYSNLQYQCSNGIPHDLRIYIWYALLLRPNDPWEIKNLYSEKNGIEYHNLCETVKIIVDDINKQKLERLQSPSKLINVNNTVNE